MNKNMHIDQLTRLSQAIEYLDVYTIAHKYPLFCG
jgi:hypothetical protein